MDLSPVPDEVWGEYYGCFSYESIDVSPELVVSKRGSRVYWTPRRMPKEIVLLRLDRAISNASRRLEALSKFRKEVADVE